MVIAARDLPAGAVLGPNDLVRARVQVPEDVLERLRLPVVLLTDEPHAGRWPRRRGLVVLPLEADAAQVRSTLAEALRGRTSEPLPLVRPRPGSTPPVERAGGGRGQLVWVTKYLGLLADTVRKQNVTADQLTIHADRGTSMASKLVALLLADLGVTKSRRSARTTIRIL